MTVRKHLCSIIAIFTICALLMTSGGSVLAASEGTQVLGVTNKENEYITYDADHTTIEYLDSDEELVFFEDDQGNIMKNPKSDGLYHMQLISETLVATENKWTPKVTPTGQPTHGTNIRDGGHLYVSTESGPSVSVSMSFGWGPISLSVSRGQKVTKFGVAVNIPKGNSYYLARIKREYTFKRYKQVYRDLFTNKTSTYYRVTKTLIRLDLYAEKV